MADMKRLVLDAQKTEVEKRCGELLLASKSHGESSETSRQAEREPGQAKSLWTRPAGSAKKEAAGQAESFWAKPAAPPGSQPGSSSDPKPASKASAVVLKPRVPSSERISEWRRRWGAMKRLKHEASVRSKTPVTPPKQPPTKGLEAPPPVSASAAAAATASAPAAVPVAAAPASRKRRHRSAPPRPDGDIPSERFRELADVPASMGASQAKTLTASASSTTETKPKRRGPESVPKSTPPSGQAVESPAASVPPPPGDSESENLD